MTLDGATLDANRVAIDRKVTRTHELVVRLGSHVIGTLLSHSA